MGKGYPFDSHEDTKHDLSVLLIVSPALKAHKELRKATENISKDGWTLGPLELVWALGVSFQRLRLIDSVKSW